MAKYTGRNLYATFAGGTITGDQRSLKVSEAIDLVDVSAGADIAKSYVAALEDGTGTLEVLDQTGGTAAAYIWNLLDKGAQGTLVWGEEGTATGKPKHSVFALVASRDKEVPYADAVVQTFEFQFSGVVSDATW